MCLSQNEDLDQIVLLFVCLFVEQKFLDLAN